MNRASTIDAQRRLLHHWLNAQGLSKLIDEGGRAGGGPTARWGLGAGTANQLVGS